MEETSGIVTVMEEVEIFTIPALFTLYKVDRESIYPGLHLYEIQARAGYPVPLDGVGGQRLLRLHSYPHPGGPDGERPGGTSCPETSSWMRRRNGSPPSEFEERYLSPSNFSEN